MSNAFKQTLMGSVAGLALAAGCGGAVAGGFQIKEQSALGQGSSFAGFGAQQALSAMAVNPSAVTSVTGTNADANITAILPTADLTAQPGTTISGFPVGFTPYNQSADIGRNAYVPSIYLNHQFKNYDPRLFIGLSVTSEFGLKTEPDKRWIGSTVGDSTNLFTINFNPVLGYKVSDQLSIAAGPAFEFAHGILKFATGTPTSPNTAFDGRDFSVGATAGLTYTPTPDTRIGLGWRSAITHELDGTFLTNGPAIPGLPSVLLPGLNAGVSSRVELRLPDIVNLSLQQAVAPNLKLLGTVEWTNWSSLKDLTVTSTSTGVNIITAPSPLAPAPAGSTIGVIKAPWQDGWFFSGGLEYAVNPMLTVRAGGAYEISPVTSATARVVSIPDANRVWASGGFSYDISNAMTLDFGYSHVFVDSAQIDRTSLGNPATATHLLASLSADIDIISLGLRVKLGE